MYICTCTWSCEACIEVRLALRRVSSEVVSRPGIPAGQQCCSISAWPPRLGTPCMATRPQHLRTVPAKSVQMRFLSAVAPLVMPRCSSRTFIGHGFAGASCRQQVQRSRPAFVRGGRDLPLGAPPCGHSHGWNSLAHTPHPRKFQWHASCWAGACVCMFAESHPHGPVHHTAAVRRPFFYMLPAPHPLIL